MKTAPLAGAALRHLVRVDARTREVIESETDAGAFGASPIRWLGDREEAE